MIRETSLEAYEAMHLSGKLTNQQFQILRAMRADRDYSLNELVSVTGLPINTISGRCCDLKKLGYLQEGPTRKCSRSGNTIHPVQLPREERAAA